MYLLHGKLCLIVQEEVGGQGEGGGGGGGEACQKAHHKNMQFLFPSSVLNGLIIQFLAFHCQKKKKKNHCKFIMVTLQ